jgi:hypothetical protein
LKRKTLKLEKVHVEFCIHIDSAFQCRSRNQVMSDAEGEAEATTSVAGQEDDDAEAEGSACKKRAVLN